MFERFTEKARRVIFFARYEASQYGTPEIDTEHILLGILRESPEIVRMLRLDVIHRKTHKASLDSSLAVDSDNFELVKGGWTKGRCAICRWEFFESTESEKKAPDKETSEKQAPEKQVQEKEQDSHSICYTNGRDWICIECYEKFWNRPDFISGSFSEMT